MTKEGAPPAPYGSEAGLTLLELLVVLALMAGLIHLSAPSISGLLPKATFRTSVTELASEFRSVRASAMLSNVERSLWIDLDERAYWSDINSTYRALPAGVTIELYGTDDAGETPRRARFRFRADGSASGGSVRLQLKDHSARVLVDWLSGYATLEWGQ